MTFDFRLMNVFLGIGSNIGDKLQHIEASLALLQQKAGTIKKVSAFYETEPWGFQSDDTFLNIVAEIETCLSPSDLFAACKNIENKLGREQKKANAYQSRPIDIDVLFYGNEILKTEQLAIPHPLIQERLFVLQPFCDIAPDFLHPILHEKMSVLLEKCADKNWVKKI